MRCVSRSLQTEFIIIIILRLFLFYFCKHYIFVVRHVTVSIVCGMCACWNRGLFVGPSRMKKNGLLLKRIIDKRNTHTHTHTRVHTNNDAPKAQKTTQTSLVASKITAFVIMKNSQEFRTLIPFKCTYSSVSLTGIVYLAPTSCVKHKLN